MSDANEDDAWIARRQAEIAAEHETIASEPRAVAAREAERVAQRKVELAEERRAPHAAPAFNSDSVQVVAGFCAVLGWVFLVVGILIVGLDVSDHKSAPMPWTFGVSAIVSSALPFTGWAVIQVLLAIEGQTKLKRR